MKKKFIIILGILVLILAGAWFWWQQNKKGIIRDRIEGAVSKGTDSLYFISYDSSGIDELAGDATFYNVRLQSATLEQQLLLYDTASAETVFNIQADKVSIRGANIPAILSNRKVETNTLEIIRPVIHIIGIGSKEGMKYDTLAIYEKILGRYRGIRAGAVIIRDGEVYFHQGNNHPHTALKGIDIDLRNFRIDSTRDYQNIISYFIKDVVAKVRSVNIRSDQNLLAFSLVEYNAPTRSISIDRFLQTDTSGKKIFDIRSTVITGISTDSFIIKQQLKAGKFKTNGGLVTLYSNKNEGSGDRVEMDNNSFDEALLDTIIIGNTKVILADRLDKKKQPLVFENARFTATGIQSLQDGTSIRQLIGRSNWVLEADKFSVLSKDKRYKYDVAGIKVNSQASTIDLGGFRIIPQLSEAEFVKSISLQQDRYDINLKNIKMKGVEIKTLISEQKLVARTAELSPVINVFNDRTVTPNPASKIGMYPHQQLQQIDFPFYVGSVVIKNASVNYKERGALSKDTGTVFFKGINGTIRNVTNIKERININNKLVLDAHGSFMGVSKLHTTWELPLNTTTGAFKVKGTATGFDATSLNRIAEPLGMASIKRGQVNALAFDMAGDDYKASGHTVLVYDNLKMELLKKDSSGLEKKGLMSFIANALVKNSNLGKDQKKVAMSFTRDTTKSFFNLVWKTIFAGTKNTIQKL